MDKQLATDVLAGRRYAIKPRDGGLVDWLEIKVTAAKVMFGEQWLRIEGAHKKWTKRSSIQLYECK